MCVFFSIQSKCLENPLRLGKSWIFPNFGHFDGRYTLQTARNARKCIYWRIDNVLRYTLKPIYNYLWPQKGVYGPPSRQRGRQNGKIKQNPLKLFETLYIAQKWPKNGKKWSKIGQNYKKMFFKSFFFLKKLLEFSHIEILVSASFLKRKV